MRRNFKWIYVCVAIVCMQVLSGCSDKQEEGILEVQEVSETSDSDKGNSVSDESEGQKKTEENIYVYICGQVNAPGVYELSADSRLYEALEAAGGMTETAADTYLNQAQKLEDGQQIYVPSREETKGQASTDTPSLPEDDRVNLNTASKEELMTLSGIGEAKADAIIRYREDKGNFQSTEELKNVEGIKDGVYNKVKEKIKI